MNAAAQAILRQTDEILVKPIDLTSLVQIINQRVASGPQNQRTIETVATILERATESTIQEWFDRIETEPTLMSIPMSVRAAHAFICGFSSVTWSLASALTCLWAPKKSISSCAADHGVNRFRQGYTVVMLVEESRILQVSIFHTLQRNLVNIDYSVLLNGVMTIADEIDFQLSLAVASYTAEALSARVYVS